MTVNVLAIQRFNHGAMRTKKDFRRKQSNNDPFDLGKGAAGITPTVTITLSNRGGLYGIQRQMSLS
jgi:hypothetical protein